jgi:hypothetical protein
MTTTKQLNSNPQCRQANGGKTYAMTKNNTITIDGVEYRYSELVPRPVAEKIANYEYSYFSSLISRGDIVPIGRGKQTRFLVEDCVKLQESKHTRKKSSNQAA